MNVNGQGNFPICFLSATLGLNTSGLHDRQTPLDSVEKQANISGAVDRLCPTERFSAQSVHILFGLSYIQPGADDMLGSFALEIWAIQTKQGSGVAFREVGLS